MKFKNSILTMLGTALIAGAVDAKEINLPGVGKVDTNQKILQNGHFTWGEATKEGTRIPYNSEIVSNIRNTAKYMEDVRHYFGDKPIKITSWYRDPETNKKTPGAAEKSQHITGKAVDFLVPGVSPREVARELERYWGSNGGLGSYSGWTHLDDRGKAARWSK